MKLEEYAAKLRALDAALEAEAMRGMNRITDRHLARYVENLPVGLSPSSPEARQQAASTPVMHNGDDYDSEVYNTAPHAGYLEKGHRQGAVGRTIFIPLREGIVTAYGQEARHNPKSGQWGIWLHLTTPFVRGNFAMRDSEVLAQREIDNLAGRLEKMIEDALS